MSIFEIRGTNTKTGRPFVARVVANSQSEAHAHAELLPIAINSVRQIDSTAASEDVEDDSSPRGMTTHSAIAVSSQLLERPIQTIALGVAAGSALWAALLVVVMLLVSAAAS